MSAAITIATLLGRPALPASTEPQLAYLLAELRPAGPVVQRERLPLNLAVVVDCSSSMRGDRLNAVRAGLLQILTHLGPEDCFSLISFNDRATIVVPAQRAAATRPEVHQAIEHLAASGGTELAHGFEAGLREVTRLPRQRCINRVLLLSDGRTYGDEARCLELARAAHVRKIGVTAIGLGAEWHEELLEAITASAESRAHYAADAKAIGPLFAEEVRRMHAVFARDVRVSIMLPPGGQVRALDRVQPFIETLTTLNAQDRWDANLGDWAGSEPQTILAELVVPPLQSGEQPITRLAVRYDLPASELTGQVLEHTVRTTVQPAGTVVLETEPTVKQWVERLVAVRLQAKAWEDLAAGRVADATSRLRMAGTRLLAAGETELAETVAAEAERIAQEGNVSEDARKRIRYGTRGLMAQTARRSE